MFISYKELSAYVPSALNGTKRRSAPIGAIARPLPMNRTAVTYNVKGDSTDTAVTATNQAGRICPIGIGSPIIIHHPSSSYCFILFSQRAGSVRNFDDTRHSDRNSSNRRLSAPLPAPLPAATVGYQHTHHRPSSGTKGGIQSKWNGTIIRHRENNKRRDRNTRYWPPTRETFILFGIIPANVHHTTKGDTIVG